MFGTCGGFKRISQLFAHTSPQATGTGGDQELLLDFFFNGSRAKRTGNASHQRCQGYQAYGLVGGRTIPQHPQDHRRAHTGENA